MFIFMVKFIASEFDSVWQQGVYWAVKGEFVLVTSKQGIIYDITKSSVLHVQIQHNNYTFYLYFCPD